MSQERIKLLIIVGLEYGLLIGHYKKLLLTCYVNVLLVIDINKDGFIYTLSLKGYRCMNLVCKVLLILSSKYMVGDQ